MDRPAPGQQDVQQLDILHPDVGRRTRRRAAGPGTARVGRSADADDGPGPGRVNWGEAARHPAPPTARSLGTLAAYLAELHDQSPGAGERHRDRGRQGRGRLRAARGNSAAGE